MEKKEKEPTRTEVYEISGAIRELQNHVLYEDKFNKKKIRELAEKILTNLDSLEK